MIGCMETDWATMFRVDKKEFSAELLGTFVLKVFGLAVPFMTFIVKLILLGSGMNG